MLYSEKVDAKMLHTQFTHTHTHTLNGPLSGTTQVSRYQKGKTNLDFTEARDSEWQWHHLGHMQVCTLLQRDNHTSTPLLSFFTGRMPFLPPNQQHQSTEDKSTEGWVHSSHFKKQQHRICAMHTSIELLSTINGSAEGCDSEVPAETDDIAGRKTRTITWRSCSCWRRNLVNQCNIRLHAAC